jgi:hypothetical protein
MRSSTDSFSLDLCQVEHLLRDDEELNRLLGQALATEDSK